MKEYASIMELNFFCSLDMHAFRVAFPNEKLVLIFLNKKKFKKGDLILFFYRMEGKHD